jgi:hypothetical protein
LFLCSKHISRRLNILKVKLRHKKETHPIMRLIC